MKKTAILFFVLAFVSFSATPIFSQQTAEDGKFQKLLDSYFDAYWKFYPTAATLAGYHNYDDKLEDFNIKNLEKRQDELDSFNKELVASIDSKRLSPDVRIDHTLIMDALDRDIMQHERLLPWEYNPIYYNEIFLNCIRGLFVKEFAPLETRAKNTELRLKELEKFIAQAKANLKTPPEIYTQTAIRQFPAVLDFYMNELPGLIASASDATKSKLQAALSKVIPALQDYQSYLQNALLPKSTGNFRLIEAHARLLRTTYQNNIPVQELIAQAQADAKNIRREMFKVCFPFYKIMDPQFDIENPPNLSEDQLINSVVSHVLNKIKDDHVEKEEFLDKINSLAEEIKVYFENNQMTELPAETLKIVAAPPEALQTSWIELVRPAPYEQSGTYTLQIVPFSENTAEDKIQGLLEEYTNPYLPFWTTAEIYPGSFVPALQTSGNASLVKRMYPNKPVLSGWAYLFGEQMIKNGFGDYGNWIRLNQLKFDLHPVITFIVEFQVHQGPWEKQDAVNYMTRVGFFTLSEAERVWEEILLNPLESTYAYVGLQEFKVLETEYKNLKGDTFVRQEFLSEVLSQGAIPFRFLKSRIFN